MKQEINEIMALIDVEAELQQFEWPGANWSQDKLIARSPFREDQSPSFFVNLTGDYKGAWGDSGATDDYYAKGGWFKLIAHLRDTSVESVIDEYRGLLTQRTTTTELPKFKIGLRGKSPVSKPALVAAPATAPTDAYCDYLQNRGISTKVSGALRVSYDPARKAIVIPWYDTNGDLVAMKYRSVRDKRFWYSPGGRPISELIYGIDRVHKRRFKTVFVTEAEIDAMSIMTAGFPAIATGGAAIGRAKIDVLRSSPVERYVLVPDADGAGDRWAAELERELKGYAEIRVLRLGEAIGDGVRGVKDANDALISIGCAEFRHKLKKYYVR